MSFTLAIEYLQKGLADSQQLLCLKYWQMESSPESPYYGFVHQVAVLADSYSTTPDDLPSLVRSLCRASLGCSTCRQQSLLEVREDLIRKFEFTHWVEGVGMSLCCERCRQPGPREQLQGGEATAIGLPAGAQSTSLELHFRVPHVWPFYPEGKLKPEYRWTARLVVEDPKRREWFEKLKAFFPLVFVQVPLSAIVPSARVEHLLRRSPSYYNPGSFHANRFHFVVCNADFRPVIAVDCLEEEDHRTQFRRTLLSVVQIPYLLLPKDAGLLLNKQT